MFHVHIKADCNHIYLSFVVSTCLFYLKSNAFSEMEFGTKQNELNEHSSCQNMQKGEMEFDTKSC